MTLKAAELDEGGSDLCPEMIMSFVIVGIWDLNFTEDAVFVDANHVFAVVRCVDIEDVSFDSSVTRRGFVSAIKHDQRNVDADFKDCAI